MDPQANTYSNQSNVIDGDNNPESSIIAARAKRKTNRFPMSSDFRSTSDSHREEDSAFDASLSSPIVLNGRDEISVVEVNSINEFRIE